MTTQRELEFTASTSPAASHWKESRPIMITVPTVATSSPPRASAPSSSSSTSSRLRGFGKLLLPLAPCGARKDAGSVAARIEAAVEAS